MIVDKRYKGKIHKGGYGPIFVGEHFMGSIPFPIIKSGWKFHRNLIYQRDGFLLKYHNHRIESPIPPSILYPISDMRHTGYIYPNRLDPRHPGSIYPTSHDCRGPRTNKGPYSISHMIHDTHRRNRSTYLRSLWFDSQDVAESIGPFQLVHQASRLKSTLLSRC